MVGRNFLKIKIDVRDWNLMKIAPIAFALFLSTHVSLDKWHVFYGDETNGDWNLIKGGGT